VIRKAAFAALLLFTLTPWCSPPLALALGLSLGLTIGNPFAGRTSRPTRLLLQASVVGLGFGMNLGTVIAAGRSGFLFTVATIAGTLILGFVLGRMLGMSAGTTHLVSSGTAICGGSAIAAVGPVIGASDEEMSVSLGTVFILNAIALFLFPAIGTALGLTQQQFGIWSAIAIHDTSSVVGAASAYGREALEIATTVKLTRALWIIPLTIGTALAWHSRTRRIAIPWFIFFFVLASVVRTYVPAPLELWEVLVLLARKGLTVTLFLIGVSLTRASIANVGMRPLILGVVLWTAISAAALWAVVSTA
jgi:uncharacterized integral membrane protein (TIGR00698 family)